MGEEERKEGREGGREERKRKEKKHSNTNEEPWFNSMEKGRQPLKPELYYFLVVHTLTPAPRRITSLGYSLIYI